MFSRWAKLTVFLNQSMWHCKIPAVSCCASKQLLSIQTLKYIASNSASIYVRKCLLKSSKNKFTNDKEPWLSVQTDNVYYQVKYQQRLAHYNPSNLVLFINNGDDMNKFCTELWENIKYHVLPVNSVNEKALENLEKIIPLLNEMKCDTRNIFSLVSSNPRIVNCSWIKFHNVVMFLKNVGLGGHPILHVLNNRDIWTSDVDNLSKRVHLFRKVGILDGKLQRLVTKCPEVLTLKKRQLNAILDFLRDNRFTREQIIAIINDCPDIFEKNLDGIEYLFQYVYFRMGLTDHKQMVQAKLFKHSLQHIRQRHLFLLRLGLYETPNARSRTSIINPKLHVIIDTSLNRFCKMFKVTSVEEFNIFCQELMEDDNDDNNEDGYDTDDYDIDNDYDLNNKSLQKYRR